MNRAPTSVVPVGARCIVPVGSRLSTLVVVLLLAACAGPSAPPTLAPSPVAVSSEAVTVATVEEPTRSSTGTAESPTVVPSETVAASPSATVAATVAASPTALPTPEPERVAVAGSGNQFVNMRREPGTDMPVVKSVRDGTEVVIVGADRQADGRIWRNVQDGDATGWIVSTALRALPTPPPTPTVTPTVAASATPTATSPTTPTLPPSVVPTATAQAAAPAPEPTASPDPEQVEVFGAGSGGANVRGEPGTGGPIVANVRDGTRLTIVGDDREVEGRTWRNVRGESGIVGWMVTEVVRSLATPTPAATATPSSTPMPTGATATPGSSSTGTPVPNASTGPLEGAIPDEAEPTPEPERVEVYGTGAQGANLRAQPGRISSVLRSVPDGSQLTVIGDDELVDGITWRNVEAEDGVRGWLAQEVVKSLLTPTPTPRPNSAGVGAPIDVEPEPEELQTEEERAATPCRPGQIKGDAATGIYYPVDRPEYAGLRERVRCFDDVTRARASGFLPAEVLAPPPSPEPSPEPGE